MREKVTPTSKALQEIGAAKAIEEIYQTGKKKSGKGTIAIPKNSIERAAQLEDIKALQRHLASKETKKDMKDRSRVREKEQPEPKISEHFLERLRKLEDREPGITEAFRTGLDAILRAGKILLEKQPHIRKGKVERMLSGRVVRTEGDVSANDLILAAIRARFPESPILSEESDELPGSEEKETEEKWYVDPLDGTRSYSSNRPNFATMLAYERKGGLKIAIIFLPARGELYYAAQGTGAFLNEREIKVNKDLALRDGFLELNQSQSGHSHLFNVNKLRPPDLSRTIPTECEGAALAALARGTTVAHAAARATRWDIAPGILLVREAGGKVTTLNGEEFDLERDEGEITVASNDIEHDRLLQLLHNAKFVKR